MDHEPISQTELVGRVEGALRGGPAIECVSLAGSRARAEETPLSDWDFAVRTSDFETTAAALPSLVERLEPISRQWDRLSPFPTYMLMLAGPIKVDLLFGDRPNPPAPPWEPSRANLDAIDAHFWDWMLWIASKQVAGRTELVGGELAKLHRHLLAPIGAERPPATASDALATYLERRGDLERELSRPVDRRLEAAVRPTVERALGSDD
jgi:predicted nucleotidyltransferase